MKKQDFIKSNFQRDCLIYSPNGDFSFLGNLPDGYRRVGIVPIGTANSYKPRHSKLCFGNDFNLVSYVIVTADGAIKPSKYQQRLIKSLAV